MAEAKESGVEPAQTKAKHPGFVRWAVIFSIAIVFNLFLVYTAQLLYPSPKYEDFCHEAQVKEAFTTEQACVEHGGQWNAPQLGPDGQPGAQGYCYADYTCNKEFQDKNSLHQRNVFIAFVIIGLVLILGASFLRGREVLSAGLSFGGVLTLIVGSVGYWSNMDDILRVAVLGVALAALVFLAWEKFRD